MEQRKGGMNPLREFTLNGLLEQVGSAPDYSIRLNAAGWLSKGVLTLQDVEQIDAAIKAKNDAAAANS